MGIVDCSVFSLHVLYLLHTLVILFGEIVMSGKGEGLMIAEREHLFSSIVSIPIEFCSFSIGSPVAVRGP
jgi:hypothetical protein